MDRARRSVGPGVSTTARAVEVFAADRPGTVLRTQRLLLRPVHDADADALAKAVGQLIDSGETTSGVWLLGEPVAHVVRRQLELTAAGLRTGQALRRAIFTLGPLGPFGQGALLGCCNIIALERGLSWHAELAFWLVPQARGMGVAHEACRAVVDHALADLPAGLGVSSVRAYVQPSNAPAQRLLRRLGFVHQPQVREHKPVAGRQCPHELWCKDLPAPR